MNEKKPKYTNMIVKVTPETKDNFQRVATKNERTISQQLRLLVDEFLYNRGK